VRECGGRGDVKRVRMVQLGTWVVGGARARVCVYVCVCVATIRSVQVVTWLRGSRQYGGESVHKKTPLWTHLCTSAAFEGYTAFRVARAGKVRNPSECMCRMIGCEETRGETREAPRNWHHT